MSSTWRAQGGAGPEALEGLAAPPPSHPSPWILKFAKGSQLQLIWGGGKASHSTGHFSRSSIILTSYKPSTRVNHGEGLAAGGASWWAALGPPATGLQSTHSSRRRKELAGSHSARRVLLAGGGCAATLLAAWPPCAALLSAALLCLAALMGWLGWRCGVAGGAGAAVAAARPGAGDEEPAL